MNLAGMLIVPSGSCVVLSPATARSQLRQPDVPAPARTRRRLRAVLGADLVREEMNGDGTTAAIEDFWHAIDGIGHPYPELAIVASGHMPVPQAASVSLACSDSRQWQGLLSALCRLPAAANAERLADLEGRLRHWYQTSTPFGSEPFSWVVKLGELPLGKVSAPGGNPSRRPAPQRALADDIVMAIRQGLAQGMFTNDDEISDRTLAQLLGSSRGRIRQALRLLADEGLVTAATESAVVVRLPAVTDVVETYAARRALGTMAVRPASRWTPAGRASVARLLEEIRRCAERQDIAGAQQADLAFQNALFQASGLARIPPMLESLTKQTLMFISVIGIRYAYPPDRIVEQDTAIFEAVNANDKDRAARTWQAKIDEGARYMVEQINLLNSHSARPLFN
ncbi:GntR family transcriptional regulator [Arthrobacter sp. GCM10027362]|uniref:GntR family transcriptional regulator n=1 Tax=Arthrobacter sp. GCM10027362 TaxID=3273379 RepID=UPI003643FB06